MKLSLAALSLILWTLPTPALAADDDAATTSGTPPATVAVATVGQPKSRLTTDESEERADRRRLDLVVGSNYTGVKSVKIGDPATAKAAAAPKPTPAKSSAPAVTAADARCG